MDIVMDVGMHAWIIATKLTKGFNLTIDRTIKVTKGKTINLIKTAPVTWIHLVRCKLDKLRFPPMTIMAMGSAASPKILMGFKTGSGTMPFPTVKTIINAANMLNKGGFIIFFKSIRLDFSLVTSQMPNDHRHRSKPMIEKITEVYTFPANGPKGKEIAINKGM